LALGCKAEEGKAEADTEPVTLADADREIEAVGEAETELLGVAAAVGEKDASTLLVAVRVAVALWEYEIEAVIEPVSLGVDGGVPGGLGAIVPVCVPDSEGVKVPVLVSLGVGRLLGVSLGEGGRGLVLDVLVSDGVSLAEAPFEGDSVAVPVAVGGASDGLAATEGVADGKVKGGTGAM
jgi:hypothetical protein